MMKSAEVNGKTLEEKAREFCRSRRYCEDSPVELMTAFAQQERDDEREACAKVVDAEADERAKAAKRLDEYEFNNLVNRELLLWHHTQNIAAAIRARGKKGNDK